MENTMQILPFLGLQITEKEYRELPIFSYSKISDFASKGHKALYEDKDISNKKGVIKGNILDRMISTRKLHPDHVFLLDPEDMPSDTTKNIVNYFINNTEDLPDSLYNCNDAHKGTLLAGALNENYGQGWKTDTVLTKIIQSGDSYYTTISKTKEFSDSIIISTIEFEKACDAYRTLLENEYVKHYFEENLDPEMGDCIQLYDQVKLVHSELALKGMLDRVLINYTKKTIIPIDFKSIGFEERAFGKTNYIGFNYDIQASVYFELLYDYVSNTPELQDFYIENFEFIVINLENLTPLVYVTPNIDPTKPLYFKNSMTKRKTWLELYQEMLKYDLSEYNPYTLEERELGGRIELDLFTQNIEM